MKLLLGLVFATALQGAMTINSGPLKCGALTRSANTVQAYCYLGTPVVFNALYTVTTPGVIASYQNTDANGVTSSITWRFTLKADGTVTFDVTVDAKTLQSGTL